MFYMFPCSANLIYYLHNVWQYPSDDELNVNTKICRENYAANKFHLINFILYYVIYKQF
jgi:hypothetical protein